MRCSLPGLTLTVELSVILAFVDGDVVHPHRVFLRRLARHRAGPSGCGNRESAFRRLAAVRGFSLVEADFLAHGTAR